MVLELRQVVLDTTDVRRAAEFWRQLLGLVYRSGHEPGASHDEPDWLNLRRPDGTPLLAFQQGSRCTRPPGRRTRSRSSCTWT